MNIQLFLAPTVLTLCLSSLLETRSSVCKRRVEASVLDLTELPSEILPQQYIKKSRRLNHFRSCSGRGWNFVVPEYNGSRILKHFIDMWKYQNHFKVVVWHSWSFGWYLGWFTLRRASTRCHGLS